MRTRRRLTLRRGTDTNGHWYDIASGEIVDSRLKPWRSVSRSAFGWTVSAFILIFGLIGWNMATQWESEVNPKRLAEKLSESVYLVACGDYEGTAFSVNLDILDSYETVLISAAHIFEQCEVGQEVELKGINGVFAAELLAKSTVSSFGENPSASPDFALLGAEFKTEKLSVAWEVSRGDWAVAMGYPWDQGQYLSFGVVSDQNATEVFVDTPLNEGNSGGPVINARGEVIGMVSHYPVESDLYPGNVEGVYDRAEGISALKKISNLCTLPKSIVPVCPAG